MSGRSPTTRNLIVAGLVGVGVGAVAAGIGLALTSGSPQNCSSQPSGRSLSRSENSLSIESSPKNVNADVNEKANKRRSQCKICGKDISSEPSVSLTCKHSFHRKCLFSSYVVQIQVNRGKTFQCPFDACQVAIPEKILESLISFH